MPFTTTLTTLAQKQGLRLLPWLVGVVFVLLSGWQLLSIIDSGEIAAPASIAPTASEDPVLQQIVRSEIFGVLIDSDEETASSSNTASADATPQATSLPYVLKGVITAATPDKGSAIIELSPGDSRYFSAGREISANITLAAVHSDHVVINNQGKSETLQLAELSLSMASVNSNPSSNFGGNDNPGAVPAPAARDLPMPEQLNNSPDSNLDPEDVIKRDRIRQRLEELRSRNPT